MVICSLLQLPFSDAFAVCLVSVVLLSAARLAAPGLPAWGQRQEKHAEVGSCVGCPW